jgi:cation:H+ antiporter
MTYVLILIGFGLLIKGADYFVEGSSKIAGLLKVPPLLIGLTIVAFGTSSPEAAVGITAALNGNPDVTIGNTIGSNILMTTLVIGLTAFILPLKVENETIRKEIPFTLLASAALLVLISDMSLQSDQENLITRSDGFIMLLFFSIFIYYIFEAARNSRDQVNEDVQTKDAKWGKNILFTLLGLAGIIIGGYLVVNSSTSIALSFGMSETLVGLTIVAIGTSLPELITSLTAAVKKQGEIALGNIIGSNIFNILFVLGLASAVYPLRVDPRIFVDVMIMILLTFLLLIFSRTQYKIAKSEGIVLTLAYIAYFVYILIRN